MVAPTMKKMLRLFVIIGLVSCTLHLASCVSYAQENRYVRVRVFDNLKSLRLKINGRYQIEDLSGNKILYQGYNLNSTVASYSEGIMVGPVSFKADRIMIRALNLEPIDINNRMFNGLAQIIKLKEGKFIAVNLVELEDYIKGIMYHEASHYWPQEALKAQAIVCRSFVISQIQANVKKDYDVTNDVYSQVYGGSDSERYRTNKVVDDTAGLALWYGGDVLPAYFHATCAGHTENAALLWSVDLEPLKGVVCGFCKDSPHFSWHNVLALSDIEKKLSGSGYEAGKIKDIIINGKDASGRVTSLKVINETKEIEITAKEFRNVVGPDEIKSTNFTLAISKDDVTFDGLGWGHGVGLCQWGAYFMAKLGHSYQEILKYYYPGSSIKLLVTNI